jgi:hypothetical protein
MKAKLTLYITYEGPDADKDVISHLLQSLVEYAADRGLLTGENNIEVSESTYEIEVG